jgi:acetyl esterase/lipase
MARRRSFSLPGLLLLLLCFVPTTHLQFTFHGNLPFVSGGHPQQVLDLYLPRQLSEPAPVLFMIHGGGFYGGSKTGLEQMASLFSGRGYAIATPDYRLAPDAIFPAQLEDVFCAFAWVIGNADRYHLDRDRVFVLGESAGGNLAALIGTVDQPERYLDSCPWSLPRDAVIKGVIVYYPVIDPAQPTYSGFFEPYMGHPTDRHLERWTEASPLTFIDGSEPPFLIIHGLWDVRVPVSESERLAESLQAAGVQVETLYLPQTDHGFVVVSPASEASLQSYRVVESFIDTLAGK